MSPKFSKKLPKVRIGRKRLNPRVPIIRLTRGFRRAGKIQPLGKRAMRPVTLDKATPPRPGRGWQKHHLIPWELRTHDAVYEYERLVAKIDNPQSARNIGKRAINSKFNNLTLPSSENSIGAEGLTIHRGSHLRYPDWIQGRLDTLWTRYRGGRGMPVETFAREFEDIIGDAEIKLGSGQWGPKVR